LQLDALCEGEGTLGREQPRQGRHPAQPIGQIAAELRRRVTTDPALARCRDILRSIPGIGPIAAIAPIVDMPELGTMSDQEAASLAGLAPITRQPGLWQGKAKIGGGRAGLCTMLHMPALVATRFNRQLGQSYQTLCQAGKPAQVAITAVMRQPPTSAHAPIRDNQKWAEINP
jgi:transposase